MEFSMIHYKLDLTLCQGTGIYETGMWLNMIILSLLCMHNHTVHTARQIPTGTSNSRCLCQRVRFGG